MKYNLENLLTLKSNQKNSSSIITKEINYSFSDLDNITTSFVGVINEKVKKGEYVGIFLDNSTEFIFSVVALWKIGAVPVLLNLLAKDDELYQLFSIAGMNYAVTNKNYSNKLAKYENVELILFNTNLQNDKLPKGYKSEVDQEAVVIFTSGATGKPKGVVHTFHSLLSSIYNGNEILNHQPGDRWLASLPFYHIGGFQIICRALYYNAAVVIPQSLQTEAISEAINKLKPTHSSFVSTQLKRLMDNKIKPNDELRCSLIGGGFIDKNLLLDAKESGWHPVKVYGSSETASFVCALSENNIEEKGFSAGKPIGTNQIFVVDEKGEECSVQTEGEIVIKSESLFKYYLRNDSETTSKLKLGSYFTGDLGYRDEDGFLFITGRKNEMIVTGGKNVNPIEVESAILKYPGIVDTAVFPVDDVEWGEIVCAAIVTSVKIDTNNLITFLKKEISTYKVPKKIFMEDGLPRTAMGKTERKKLKAKYNSKH